MLNASKRARSFLAGAVLATALGGCATGKIWSHDERTGTDNSAEHPGSEHHTAILRRSGIPAKTDLQDYVATVGRKVAAASDCPKVTWTFSLLDSPQAQAFSMPGGYVYINRGMMEMLRSENELAAILAHEVAHICTHDGPRQEAIGQVAVYSNLALLASINPWWLTSIFVVPEIALLPGAGTMAGISRHDEFNADRHGAEYLRRAGYPPEGMSAALEVLAGLEAYDRDHRKQGERVFGRSVIPMGRVYADHPRAAKRKAKLGGAEAPAPDPEFLARLEGLEVGSTRREGIPYGRKRYFPDWDVALEVPHGWKASGGPMGIWVFREDRKGSMRVESVGTGITTGDLCEELASLAEKEFRMPGNLADLQRSSEGGVRSCKGFARGVRVGIVAPDATPGARFFYREYRRDAKTDDPIFLSITRSIESLGEAEDRPAPPALHVRKAREGDTFASLAKTARGIPNAEAVLRLLNLRYPSGEPEVGQLVKVIE